MHDLTNAYNQKVERQLLNETNITQGGEDQEFQDLLNKMIEDPALDNRNRALVLRLSQDF